MFDEWTIGTLVVWMVVMCVMHVRAKRRRERDQEWRRRYDGTWH
jgi:hypothetical protein